MPTGCPLSSLNPANASSARIGATTTPIVGSAPGDPRLRSSIERRSRTLSMSRRRQDQVGDTIGAATADDELRAASAS